MGIHSNTDDFVSRSKKIHGDRYDYTLVNYINNKISVDIICKTHGRFKQSPQNHLKGQNCPKCVCNRKVFTNDDFINVSNKIYRNKYNYSKFDYIDSHTPSIIICPHHGEYLKKPNKHLNGQGCPECGIEHRRWSGSFKWKSYTLPDGRIEMIQGYEGFTLDYLLLTYNSSHINLGRHNIPIISYEWQGKIHKYFPDCYIPNSNTLIETKSSYTWEFEKDQNFAKINGSLKEGYNIRVIVWDRKKQLVSDIIYGNS